MKKSKYIDTYKVRICVAMGHRDERELEILAEMAARLAEDVGVQWDPEEPELPERVFYNDPSRCLSVRTETGWRPLSPREHREAAAHYNAGKRLEDDWYGQQMLGRFKIILDEERAKLV